MSCEATYKLRSETKRLKEQIKQTLEFNQATKQIEPLEYIYICTTEYYQKQHKFKVGGVQTFDLLNQDLLNTTLVNQIAKLIFSSMLKRQ